jgi:hypothetical protein
VSRRSNGEGAIYKRKDGRWVGKYTVNGNRKCVYDKIRREVTRKLAKALSEVAGGLVLERDNLILKQYLDSWLKNSVGGTRRAFSVARMTVRVVPKRLIFRASRAACRLSALRVRRR